MAQDCMFLFEREKLADLASVEQVWGTEKLLSLLIIKKVLVSVAPLVLHLKGKHQKASLKRWFLC